MSRYRIIRYALSTQTKIVMYDEQIFNPIEILFQDQVLLSDGHSKPYLVSLQLTSESLIIQPIDTNHVSKPRNVTIKRDPITHSLGFSIKGGKDTGFPVLISRVNDTNSHLLHIGDEILSINHDNISNLTHDEVITKLRNTANNEIHLTVKYMTDMAKYLNVPTTKVQSTLTIRENSLTLPRRMTSSKARGDQYQISAEYYSTINQEHLSLIMTDEEQITIQEYPLLYAYVSQYINGTDKRRKNSFQLHTLDGCQTGIIITKTLTEQYMWISRINMVIRHLTQRTLTELNQKLLSSEQVFYANWIYERIVTLKENSLPKWKPVFIVFKGNDLYIFDENEQVPLSSYDFIYCKRIYSIIEIFIETVLSKYSIDDRQYCFTLTLPNDLRNHIHYLNFETINEYEDFILSYQRSLYISVYSIQNRIFGCVYHGQICRLCIDINKGLQMYNNQTNVILWSFTFEQLKSSSDNGRDKIYFEFRNWSNESTIRIEVQCQHLRTFIHVLNAFLTVKYLGQRNGLID